VTRTVARLVAVASASVTIFAFGTSAASSEVGLQSVNLACNDGTNVNLALDATALAPLTNAVSAVNLYPAGDPPLGCTTSQGSNPSGASGPKDFAVGGGRVVGFGVGAANISISAHAASDAATTSPQPGVGGTVNASQGFEFGGKGHLDSKVDCFVSPAPTDPMPGTAQATAVVTRSTGIFSAFFPPGTEIRWDLFDSGMPQPAPNGDSFVGGPTSSPCAFSGYIPPTSQSQLTQGNINVKNDDF
jgi:hypothetical protein